MRLVLALHQSRQHVQVSAEVSRTRVQEERRDPGTVPLPVAIDPTVALFDPDQAPRDVVMHELVALHMEVDAFRSDIAGDEHPDRTRLLLEGFDDLLLLDVAD